MEAVTQRCSVEKVYLEVPQNSQENTYVRVSFLIKLQASGLQLYLKRRLWHRCFTVNVAKFLRTPFLQNSSGRLEKFFKNSCYFVTITYDVQFSSRVLYSVDFIIMDQSDVMVTKNFLLLVLSFRSKFS